MHATSTSTTPSSSSLHHLLSKALSPSVRSHLFPPLTLHVSPPPSPTPFTLSVTTPSTDFNFALLLSPTSSHGPLTLGTGLIHGPFPSSHPPSHLRFARHASDATSLEAYHLPYYDLLLLVLSHRRSPTSSRSFKALFRRSTFLNILSDTCHNPLPAIDQLTLPLLYCTNNEYTRICPDHSPVACACAPFPPPNPDAHHTDFASHMHTSVGEFEALATKTPFVHGQRQHQSSLILSARTAFYALSDPVLARRLAQEMHPPPNNGIPLVDLAVPSLDAAFHSQSGDDGGVGMEHDVAEALHSARIDDPLARLDEQLGADFLAGMAGENAPASTIGSGVDELAGLEFLGLPAPMLVQEVRNGQTQQMDFELGGATCEALLQQSVPREPVTAGAGRNFAGVPSGTFGLVEGTAGDLDSLSGIGSPSQEFERSPSGSTSPANWAAMEHEEAMQSTLRLKAEIRKERNRASALRSNMRKRAIRDTMKMELLHSKEKVQLLRSREVLLRQENMRLRGRIRRGDGIVRSIVRNS